MLQRFLLLLSMIITLGIAEKCLISEQGGAFHMHLFYED